MSTSSAAHDSAAFQALTTVSALLDAAAMEGFRFCSAQTELDTSGLDFLVLHATDDDGVPWILRTPRRADVFASTIHEAAVLRLVQGRLPITTPEWRIHTPRLIAYPRVAGTPAVTVNEAGITWNGLDAKTPTPLFLETFGAFLAALHAITPDDPAAATIPRRVMTEVRTSLAHTMDTVRGALQPTDALWARWQRWLADDTLWPSHPALVHGDLHAGHWLLDPTTRLIGVLDWTEASFTDPALDFAMFQGHFGTPALRALLRAFEAAGGRTFPGLVRHAEERWAAFPALSAEWALRTGNDAVLAHTRSLLLPE